MLRLSEVKKRVAVIEAERAKTAAMRFYLFTAGLREKYRYTVCDATKQAGEKVIGKFKTLEDAELFVLAKREQYTNGIDL